ncbi:transcription elongation regulator 1-like protein [Myotis myotis]|uniref:transcription elongation regulator 1-like protein n=1 Tax=Myotis myotis TaxID=51298 RepID=UPI00174EB482|nr:transcription elongation regulator 1-like protein [Myotis myotis]
MLVGARLQRRRRQPLLWPMNADPPPPPPWVWMVPGSTGLLRLGAGVAPPPVLLAAAQPPAAPLLPGLPGWQAPGEPLLPLVPLPSAPDHAAAAAHYYPLLHGQWLLGGPSPSIGLSPSSTVELVPIFPHVCPPALPTPVGKGWIDKQIPNCKIFLNNSFALDSTWIYPEESRLFHGYEKPHLLANQVAVSLSRPAPASRPLPTVVLAPQPIPGGCHNSLKPVGSSPAIAIAAAAAAMVSVDAEGLGGPSPSSAQPCHFLTLAPIKIPLRTVPFPAPEDLRSSKHPSSRIIPPSSRQLPCGRRLLADSHVSGFGVSTPIPATLAWSICYREKELSLVQKLGVQSCGRISERRLSLVCDVTIVQVTPKPRQVLPAALPSPLSPGLAGQRWRFGHIPAEGSRRVFADRV